MALKGTLKWDLRPKQASLLGHQGEKVGARMLLRTPSSPRNLHGTAQTSVLLPFSTRE